MTDIEQAEPSKKFALTDQFAKLEKVKFTKRVPKKRINKKTGEEMPVESSGDENVLKATLGLYIDTDDYEILNCFAGGEPFKFLYANRNVPSLIFTNHLMNYELTINESLEIELADIKGFKATLYVKDGKTYIRLYFSVVCVIDGRMGALIQEYWKEEVTLSCEPSTPKPVE